MSPRHTFIAGVVALVAITRIASADGARPADATASQRAEAQVAFSRGRDLYEKKSYAEARAALLASLAEVASPNTRLFLARCERDAGHLVAAHAAYGQAIAEAKDAAVANPDYAKAGEAATEERAALEKQLAFVTVRATGADRLTIAGVNVPTTQEATPLAPGRVEIVARGAAGGEQRVTLELTAGERREITLDVPGAASTPTPAPTADMPPPAAEEKRDGSAMRTGAYAAGGVGVAGIATFAIFGVLSRGTYSDLEAACGAAPCPPERADDISRGRTQQTIANVGLAIGAIGLATGATLFVLSMPKKSTQARVSVAPGWVGVRGSF